MIAQMSPGKRCLATINFTQLLGLDKREMGIAPHNCLHCFTAYSALLWYLGIWHGFVGFYLGKKLEWMDGYPLVI